MKVVTKSRRDYLDVKVPWRREMDVKCNVACMAEARRVRLGDAAAAAWPASSGHGRFLPFPVSITHAF